MCLAVRDRLSGGPRSQRRVRPARPPSSAIEQARHSGLRVVQLGQPGPQLIDVVVAASAPPAWRATGRGSATKLAPPLRRATRAAATSSTPACANAAARNSWAASSLAWVSAAGVPGTTRAVSRPGSSMSVGALDSSTTRCAPEPERPVHRRRASRRRRPRRARRAPMPARPDRPPVRPLSRPPRSSRITASVTAIAASSRSTLSSSRCAASILASRAASLSASSRSASWSTICAGSIDAGLTGLHHCPRFFGGGLGRLVHLGGGGQFFGGCGRRGRQLCDRSGPLVDVGPQPPSFGDRRNRGGVAGFSGGGDQLGLLELPGQRVDGVRRGLSRREPLRGPARSSASRARSSVSAACRRTASSTSATAAARRASSSSAARSRLVAAAHSPVGRPVRREIAQILRLDAVDQQRFGAGQRDGLTGGHVECA